MDQIVINCDLGEDEPDAKTRALIRGIDAANICCGVHAGSPEKTRRTLRWAGDANLSIGAHPGMAAAGGRGAGRPDPAVFAALLRQQIGFFRTAAEAEGLAMDYIKLHGTLYHAVEADPDLAEIYLQIAFDLEPRPAIACLAGGSVARRAADHGLTVLREAFIDRAYRADGSLVPRSEEGAVLELEAAVQRFDGWLKDGELATVEGSRIRLEADTWCVHGDGPEAEALLEALQALKSR
jgi:UPF0271 protein